MNNVSVFISYSHKDEDWKDRLTTHLGVLQKQGLLTFWEDRQIGAGEDWFEKIQGALNEARVAILLISADYLSSEFILREEVERLLRRRGEEGLIIIPVIVRSCAWKQVPWLQGLQVRPLDGRPLASIGGDRRDEALSAIATQVSGLLNQVERPGLPAPPSKVDKSIGVEGGRPRREHLDVGDGRKPLRRAVDKLVDRLRPKPDYAQQRRTLLKEVRRIWVEGRLKDMSGPVGVPFSIRVNVRDASSVATPTGTADDRADINVYQHFVTSDYRMVILGEGGTGKTYKLLQLLKELLDNVPDNPSARIPVYFNLSSWVGWAGREESMHDWLVARLKADYNRSDDVARTWAGSGQLVLLLDGLDEITTRSVGLGSSSKEAAEEKSRACRRECLDQLNRYINVTGAEVALCCCAEDYDVLGVMLDTRRDDATVEVLPLTEEDVYDSLKRAGSNFASLREAIEADPQLRKMAQIPFMLKAIATVYKQTPELTARSIIESGRGDEEARKAELFEKYVKALHGIAREKYAETEPDLLTQYELKDIKSYLSKLAEKMEQGDSRLFFVDHLQPDGVWLDDSDRRLYRALVSLFLFAFMWLVVGIPSGWALGFENSNRAAPTFERLQSFDFGVMFQAVLCSGGLAAAGFALTKGWGFGVACGLAVGAGRAISRGMGTENEGWLMQGVVSAALGAAVLVPAVYLRCYERDRIRLLQSSKLHPWQAFIGVCTAVGVGIVLALILSQMRDPMFGIARGLSFGSALIPVLGLSYGYLSTSYEMRTSTNQGLRHSANFALSSAAACSLLGAACFGAIYGSVLPNPDEGITNAILGLSLSVISLLFGGMPVLQHQGLRSILYRRRVIPHDLVGFLDVATKLKLLRPVGGGHMFEHEFLRKYFLNLRRHLRRD